MGYVPYFMAQLEWHSSVGHGVSWFVTLEGQIVLPLHILEVYVTRRGPVPLILNLGTGWR